MRKVLAFLLLILMILPPLAAPRTALSEGEPEPEIVEEVLGLRETNSETFALSDGSYECVVYASDKYYDAGGSVPELIDNSIIEKRFAYGGKEYAYSNAANSTRYYFAAETPDILISYKTKHLSFSLAGAAPVTAVPGGSRNNKQIGELSLSGENKIAYEGAFQGVEFIYAAKNGVLKEYIVLESPEAPRSFTFLYDMGNYTVDISEEGLIVFLDKDGEPVFELANLFAIDSAEAYTEELTYTIGETENGITPITVTLSEEYANAPERVYPIVIDPSTSISGSNKTYDSFVSSGNPNSNYYQSSYLRFGYDDNYEKSRSYIKFDIPSSIIGKVVSKSYISLRPYDYGTSPSLKAYRVTGSWTSSTVTWNNKPGITSELASNTAGVVNSWYRFYVTNIVRRWCDGTFTNYGFMIRNSSESGSNNWSRFYSSDSSTSYKPQLRIRYYSNTGTRFYEPAPSGGYANCMGYALGIGSFLEFTDIDLHYSSLNGKNVNQICDAMVSKLSAYLNTNIGSSNWKKLDNYYDDPPDNLIDNSYRAVLRVGLVDKDDDQKYDYGGSGEDAELILFHWYYQTCSYGGAWAHKPGASASDYFPNYANKEPSEFDWYCSDYDVYYTSDIICFAIKTRAPVNWANLAQNNNP